jgi:hypothetical protein
MKSLIILAALSASPVAPFTHTPKGTEIAMVCTFTGEQEQSGLNRICYYNCMGSKTAITVKATDICPIQITQ